MNKSHLLHQMDPDGQPVIRALCSKRVQGRSLDELIGLCRGVMADGVLVEAEVRTILRWLDANPHVASTWPASVLLQRIQSTLLDEKLDEAELRELSGLLLEVCGDTGDAPGPELQSTRCAFDDPLPVVVFEGRTFCFTGKFAVGPRDECGEAVERRGGFVTGSITMGLNYLVVGEFASRDWAHSTHGRKIETALRYRERGCDIGIVPERHWAAHL